MKDNTVEQRRLKVIAGEGQGVTVTGGMFVVQVAGPAGVAWKSVMLNSKQMEWIIKQVALLQGGGLVLSRTNIKPPDRATWWDNVASWFAKWKAPALKGEPEKDAEAFKQAPEGR